jgi:hypothetical protein
LRDTVLLQHEGDAFVVGAGGPCAREWLTLRLRPLIERTLAAITGRAATVTFVVGEDVGSAIRPDRFSETCQVWSAS